MKSVKRSSLKIGKPLNPSDFNGNSPKDVADEFEPLNHSLKSLLQPLI